MKVYFVISLLVFASFASCLDEFSRDVTVDVDYEISPLAEELLALEQEESTGFTSRLRNLSEDIVPNSCGKREASGTMVDFYYFVPSLKAKLIHQGDSFTFENRCFKTNTITLEELGNDTITLRLTASDPASLLCRDFYLFSTARIQLVKTIFLRGDHTITFKKLKLDDHDDISKNGIRVLGFCQGVTNSLLSIIKTARLYLGGFSVKKASVPRHMQLLNLDFMRRYVGVDYKERGQVGESILKFDKKTIKSGDFIAIFRTDGLDQLIGLGTGSTIGHTAIASWIGEELYIMESQDGWYWPRHGIQRNKYDDWVKMAHNADFNVLVLPLKEEYRAKLNVEKALDWFRSVEGLNYGYHNFIFSFLDSRNNLPEYVDLEVLLPLLSIFEKIIRQPIKLIFGDALNMRLGTYGYSIPQIAAAAARQGMTVEDLVTIPEQQHWKYEDGENYVCSAFCAGFYKAGGLFGDLKINPQEFSPKDIYQLDFFDTEYKKPQECLDADPDTPYCQIMGKYRIIFKGVGTIKPYDNMNERCDSQAPKFIRNEGC